LIYIYYIIIYCINYWSGKRWKKLEGTSATRAYAPRFSPRLWFQSLWQWDPFAALPETLPPPIGEDWSSKQGLSVPDGQQVLIYTAYIDIHWKSYGFITYSDLCTYVATYVYVYIYTHTHIYI